MLDDITTRPARKSECRVIAQLYSISSDGVADYIWTQMAEPGEDILDVGQRRYEREGTAFSFENCTMFIRGNDVLGMLVAFPMDPDPSPGEESDPVLRPYSELELPGSFYVCGMAVFPEHRNRGIGTRMLTLANQHAARRDLDQLSLIVFEQNAGAKRLYERHGFSEIMRRAVVPHPLLHYTGHAILMSADVTR